MDSVLTYQRRSVTEKVAPAALSINTHMIITEAERLGIDWQFVPQTNLLQMSFAGRVVRFHRRIPPQTSSVAGFSCKNKQITRNLLQDAGVTINAGFAILPEDGPEYRSAVFAALSKPVVVKPADSSEGFQVFLHIRTRKAFDAAINQIAVYNKETAILVEEQFVGDELRIVCTQEKVVGVIRRVPPHVTGNGKLTIEQLAAKKSKKHAHHRSPALKPLLLDDVAVAFLATQNLTIHSILAKGQTVYFQDHALLAIDRGGDTEEVTDQLHPSVHAIAIKTIQAIPGLAWGGIDFMCKDFTKQQTARSYRVIEVNASPCLDWQQYPAIGKSKNVIKAFLTVIFPELSSIGRLQHGQAAKPSLLV